MQIKTTKVRRVGFSLPNDAYHTKGFMKSEPANLHHMTIFFVTVKGLVWKSAIATSLSCVDSTN